MTYRVEYNGSDLEMSTVDAAVEAAKQAILSDVGLVSGWTIEHDEAINDWFIQGVRNGELVGSTAVVSGPEPVATAEELAVPHRGETDRYRSHRVREPYEDGDYPVRSVSFVGVSATEVFGKATTWLAGRSEAVQIGDVSWHQAASAEGPFGLRIYYRAD